MNSLSNHLLQVKIKFTGAELCAINAIKSNTEFIWQANADIWGSHAPNLFPIIGSMKDDSYIYNGKTYHMIKHGFARANENFEITKSSETEIKFRLNSNDTLHKMYPFLFQFDIDYTLKENVLTVNHTVFNKDSNTMYFSVGGHPAFNCPLYKDETYTDYNLEFEKPETSQSYLLNMTSGLVTDQKISVFTEGHKIPLHKNLFNNDALIFKDLKSRKVTLNHKSKGPVLSVSFNDFPFLGIWAKPNAPYVCIEPWLGIADSETTNQNIEEKEGIIALNAGETFSASYNIEIDHRHLV
ncbi:aldose 1-epimerase family protein [Winogradskyella sp.]|nr:aldose 1-epimerase family protein [Winogradskyella sp.]MDC0006788.1 aldose 1-epimerase family protein [Winogradskyella sp.]MDC1504954.1 aldose 1-epimerase family protein [Winogradskyella sp.]